MNFESCNFLVNPDPTLDVFGILVESENRGWFSFKLEVDNYFTSLLDIFPVKGRVEKPVAINSVIYSECYLTNKKKTKGFFKYGLGKFNSAYENDTVFELGKVSKANIKNFAALLFHINKLNQNDFIEKGIGIGVRRVFMVHEVWKVKSYKCHSLKSLDASLLANIPDTGVLDTEVGLKYFSAHNQKAIAEFDNEGAAIAFKAKELLISDDQSIALKGMPKLSARNQLDKYLSTSDFEKLSLEKKADKYY